MIKVNLIGASRGKKATKAATTVKVAGPTSFTPIVLLLVAVGFAAGGYWWYSSLTNQASQLNRSIQGLETRKASLEAVIKQDQIYEKRKKMLEARVQIIEGLLKNQLSPVLALDQLAEAVERTHFVWLSNLDQREAILNMNGTSTS